MWVLLNLVIIFLIIFVNENSSAYLNPALVRIRMHKELTEFPKVPGAHLKQISVNIWALNGDSLKINYKYLPHNNFIIKNKNGRYDVISVLQFNEYLAGVVGSEMPVVWPLEALKAQAVVARSYTLARIKERSSKLFHLDSDQNDQVFLLNNSSKTKMAVAQTDGVILRTLGGAVVKAYYHSDCGGETVRASDVWGANEADTGTAKDPWCAEKKSNKWNFEMAKNEFLQKIEMKSLDSQTNYIGHKAQFISLGGVDYTIQKLREIFGFFRIRSSVNMIEINEDKIKITGQGFGHGAGLCQWGTLAQVRQGRSYLEVLAHYYPKAKIAKDSLRLSLNLPMNLPRNTVSN